MGVRHRSANRDRNTEAGFTLVELLVGVALFSLLAILLVNNVGFGFRAWQRGTVHAAQFERTLVAQDLLRRLIGNLYPMLVTEGGTQYIDFDGGPQSLGFLADAPVVAGSGGRFRYRIFVERQKGGANLIMSATPELARPNDNTLTRRTVLVPDIETAEFSYFGAEVSNRVLQWQDSWIQRIDPPSLVRIRIAFRAADAQPWPDLVIAPRITADVSCVYDPGTRRCRGR